MCGVGLSGEEGMVNPVIETRARCAQATGGRRGESTYSIKRLSVVK
jgi:hypothetical protein